MEEAITKNQYELAYHLMPELDEKELPGKVAEIEQIITDNGGAVLKSQEPRKKHLSYPIKLKHYAYFGVFEFESPAESIEKINAQLKLKIDVLRYLLIHGYGSGKVLRSLTPSGRRVRPTKTEGAQARPVRPKEEPAAKPEEMEKQLEDVIENI